MDQDTEFTPMIFRTWKNGHGKGEVIALMPTLPGDIKMQNCSSYMHVGQHSTAHYLGVMQATGPATQKDFMPLVQELESLGYRVLRKMRASPKMHKLRVHNLLHDSKDIPGCVFCRSAN